MNNIIWPISFDNYSNIYKYNYNTIYILFTSIVIMTILVILYSYEYNITVNLLKKINNLLLLNQNIFWFNIYYNSSFLSSEIFEILFNNSYFGLDTFILIDNSYNFYYWYYKLSIPHAWTSFLQTFNIMYYRSDITVAFAAYINWCDIPLFDMVREYYSTVNPFSLFLQRMYFVVMLRPYIYWLGLYSYYHYNLGIYPRLLITGFDINMMFNEVLVAFQNNNELITWISTNNDFLYHTSNLLLSESALNTVDRSPTGSLLSTLGIFSDNMIFLPNTFVSSVRIFFDFNVYLPVFLPVESATQWLGFRFINVVSLFSACFDFIGWHFNAVYTFVGFEAYSLFYNNLASSFDVNYLEEVHNSWEYLTSNFVFYIKLYYVEFFRGAFEWFYLSIVEILENISFSILLESPMFYGLWSVTDRIYVFVLFLLCLIVIPGYISLVTEIIFKDFWLLQIVWDNPSLWWRNPRFAQDMHADQMLIMEYLQPKPWFNYDALVMRFQIVSYLIGGALICFILLWQVFVRLGLGHVSLYSYFPGDFWVSVIWIVIMILICWCLYIVLSGIASIALKLFLFVRGEFVLLCIMFILFKFSNLLNIFDYNSASFYLMQNGVWFGNLRRNLLIVNRNQDPSYSYANVDLDSLVNWWHDSSKGGVINVNFINMRFTQVGASVVNNNRTDLNNFDSVFTSYYDNSYGYINFYDHNGFLDLRNSNK